MNGLKLEPGWRHACVTWLNLFRLKSNPPTSALAPRHPVELGGDERGLDLRQLDDLPDSLRVAT